MSSQVDPLKEQAYWLAWSQIKGVGPVLLQKLQRHFGSLQLAWSALPLELRQVDGIGEQTIQAIDQGRSHLEPIAFWQQHNQQNPNFWTPADPDYPQLLLEIPNCPPALYYKGQVDLTENQGLKPAIAIVGTRDPSEYGRRWTRKLTTALAQQGFTIVSGLANGIDTEAHQSCLAAGGRTIAVLGTGVDVVYPWRNQKLYEAIAQAGLIVSEYVAGTRPDRAHFPQRNRIIAGLCRATLVTEAPQRSGALITAHLANDFGRDVYIVPGSLDNPKARGCLSLIDRGAQVILDEADLLERLGTLPSLDQPLSAKPTSVPTDLEPELQAVLQVLGPEPLLFDVLVQAVTLDASTISAALLQLELLGLITQLPGMRYQRCS
ncbi:MAG: DNA-processing protein DprA [Cyanobacteria bacterium P01_H01_bin.121]